MRSSAPAAPSSYGPPTIAAFPAAVAVSDLEKLIFEILETAEGELRGLSMEDIRRNIATSVACRAAIKIKCSWIKPGWNGCWPRSPPPIVP